MADTGLKSPTVATGSKTGAATVDTPNNIKVSDDADCILSVLFFDTGTATVEGSSFSPGVPPGATIDGIEVLVESSDNAAALALSPVVNVSDGTTYGTSKIATPNTDIDTIITYGSSSDLWGLTWDATKANALKAKVEHTAPGGFVSGTWSIDHIQVRIYYTEAATIIPLDLLTISATVNTVIVLATEVVILNTLSTSAALNDITVSVLPAGDFNIQRITGIDFGLSEDSMDFTTAAGDFTTVVMANTIVRLTNTNNTGSGLSANTTNAANDDIGITIELITPDTIRIMREPTGVNLDCVYQIEIIEYIGAAGGANEFIVRGRGNISLAASSTTGTAIIAGIINVNNCVPILAGQRSSRLIQDWRDGNHRLTLTSSSEIQAERLLANAASVCSFTVVEYTGSSWEIGHFKGSVAAVGTYSNTLYVEAVTQSTVKNIINWNNCFIEKSQTSGAASGLSSQAIVFKKGINTTTFSSVTSTDANILNMKIAAHAIYNPNINVQHLSVADPGVDNIFNVTITAVASLAKTSVVGSMASTGTGVAYSRYQRGLSLLNTTTVEFRGARTGNLLITELQVIEWNTPIAHTGNHPHRVVFIGI